jgi:sulfoxide reductase heme-binding subunit YedZ
LKHIVLIKRLAFVAALLPAAALAYNAYTGDLSANPVDYIEDFTGDWTIAMIVISLCVTPIRRLTKWNAIIRLRRMLGLFAFFYATLHVATWIALVSFFDVPTMLEDISMRPFIMVGMATFLILLTLAVTSNQLSIRRLGRRWATLHRLVYIAAVGAVVHFWQLVKADTTEPRRWAVVVALLLGFRIWWTWRTKMLSPS